MNAAREKVEAEGECRACGGGRGLEAAHLWTRAQGSKGFDEPDEIVPLCNALQGADCHGAFDRGELDLAGLLTVDEEVALVQNAYPISGRGSGIERARRRIAPLAYSADRRETTSGYPADWHMPGGTVFDG